VRLLCFAHAGGGSLAYRGWRHPTGAFEVVPVVLPGREGRWSEPMPTGMSTLVRGLLDHLGPDLAGDYALFGHSFGAGVAYELTRVVLDERLRAPRLLAVSGRRAPHRPAVQPCVHDAPDETFLAHLAGLGGIPDEVREHPSLLATFLPVLRADFAVHETYCPSSMVPMAVPVSVFSGATDPAVSIVDILAWRDITAGAFRARVYDGGHFYLRQHGEAILRAIHDDLGGQASA
jgi:medium-chain acyl-[acyl-carrier-protein] hydrolase